MFKQLQYEHQHEHLLFGTTHLIAEQIQTSYGQHDEAN